MHSFFGNKAFDEIGYEDIVDFIKQRIPENLFLDYKGDILRSGSLPKAKEFGKDVSAFANTSGGWIIYGIATDEKDEVKPLERDAIVGIEDQPGLREKIENKILSSIVPKPFYRIKKIDIKDKNRCVILVYIPQSYQYVHMTIANGENRFYKRREFSSEPMDYYEIKKRFEEIGQTEEYRHNLINKLTKQASADISGVSENNLLSLISMPKLLLEGSFNDGSKIRDLFNNFRGNIIMEYGRAPRRRHNRFITELFYDTELVSRLNYFYNGIVIQSMPVDLDNAERVDATEIGSLIYYFIGLIQEYYGLFDFQGVIDIQFELRGITNKELIFADKEQRRLYGINFTIEEEIEPQMATLDISDLEVQKAALTESFVLPLFYSVGLNKNMGLFKEDGTPFYSH